MERFNLDAVAASNLLKRLSQQTSTRPYEVAQRLVDADHPARSS